MTVNNQNIYIFVGVYLFQAGVVKVSGDSCQVSHGVDRSDVPCVQQTGINNKDKQ